MGTGIDLAAIVDPDAAAAMDSVKEQVLILLVQRLGGEAVLTIKEIDEAPVAKALGIQYDPVAKTMTFSVLSVQASEKK